MIALELVQSRLWDGIPSHYPEVHARAVARNKRLPSLCGIARTVRIVDCDPFQPLFDQISCLRCRRMLERQAGR